MQVEVGNYILLDGGGYSQADVFQDVCQIVEYLSGTDVYRILAVGLVTAFTHIRLRQLFPRLRMYWDNALTL